MKKAGGLYEINDHVDEENVNLTPLIDVVFVVLIMFILVAPLLEHDKISLAPSTSNKKKELTALQEKAPIKIYVHKDNTIFFNETPVTIEELLVCLKHAHQKLPHAHPQLYHDKMASFGTYQSIKNVVESAGFETLDVILKSN